MIAPTHRFSSRVQHYTKYRPSYPPQIIDILGQVCGLNSEWVVADIGSGTGLLAELFLKNSLQVLGVEPNREMREAGERLLQGYRQFVSIDGTAESTTLAAGSVDLVAAGQAFHWFDQARARAEFVRILKPGGWVALIWNNRRSTGTPFLEAYDQLLRTYGTDYMQVSQQTKITSDMLNSFFGAGGFEQYVLSNQQVFDYDGLEGRLRSSSYTPEPGHPRFEPMIAELRRIFAACNTAGHVAVEYDTQLYVGRLGR